MRIEDKVKKAIIKCAKDEKIDDIDIDDLIIHNYYKLDRLEKWVYSDISMNGRLFICTHNIKKNELQVCVYEKVNVKIFNQFIERK